MTYKALYRSYRPQKFDDVVGQQHIVKTLQNAIRNDKISHAYLFSGPRGTGKTTIAKLLAKALLCQEENKPCGQCVDCNEIRDGQHPDVIEIDAASNNGVGEVRELIDKVKYAPIQGKYKVYIIDEVHMMTPEASNALLKTLEEPPKHAIFIFATTEIHKILSTIISRCQRFDFTKVEDVDIIQRLTYVLDSENRKYEKAALPLIAKLSDGGMRDALSVLEQCLAYQNELTEKSVLEVYGLLSMEQKINFLLKIFHKDMKEVLRLLEEMLASGIDIKRFTYDLIDILKDIVIYKNTNDVSILFVLNKQDVDMIVPYITVEETFMMIDQFLEACRQYTLSLDAKTYFELAVLKICNNVKQDTKEIVIDRKPIIEATPIIKKEVEIIKEEPTIIIEEPTILVEQVEIKEPEPTQKQQEVVIIDKKDILNILVQANKESLTLMKSKWSIIERYELNAITCKAAINLKTATPVAACKEAVIIMYDDKVMADIVNDNDEYKFYKELLLKIYNQPIECIALSKEEWQEVRNQYVQLRNENKLPEPKKIQENFGRKENVLEKSKLTKAQQKALDLFGEDIVDFEE
ncbi:DNA polymerase III subunit gamma/tau [Tannockella kyphosi]|uniref:DNA polymerase III subunit gamma/tau n=1 Tax=Tannockella kyphosi TaxID=2899121 RepID=UPI00201182AC|nr:DNA polymerase III subunit gamma/tau [Tannockella kyphosi]